ncbi:hypothetical protein tb265_19890 [Gemmatimonadetes bacterium T265]|nr:hypothetical protein tb265_19890 [Gemmatimonadetes bacterium T265]
MNGIVGARIWGAVAVALLAVAGARRGAAQSPFSTAKADGSIVLDRGGFAQATFDEALFRVGYELDRRDEHARDVRARHPTEEVRFGPRYGLELQARPGGSVAALLRSNELVSGGRAVASFGLGNVFSTQPSTAELVAGRLPAQPLGLVYDWITVEAGVERTTFTLYDATQPYAAQFASRDFSGYSLTAHYNAEFGGRVPTIAGVSVGVRKTNNADELAAVSITDTHVITSPDGSVQRTYSDVRQGLTGDYAERRPVVLNTDVVFYPFLVAPPAGATLAPSGLKASVAFDVFTRTTLGADARFVPGLGAFVTAPGAPLRVYGGVTVYRGRDKSVASNLVAGFSF